MSSLRFCMITTFYPPYNFGGDGIAIQRLSQALVRRGHHVTVIHDVDAFNCLNDEPPSHPAEKPSDGVEVLRLSSRLGPLSMLLTHQLGRPVFHGRKIQQTLDQGHFDVINFNNISLVGGPGILSAGNALKLYMAHEHWLVCASHVLWRHNREACTGRECFRCVLHYHRLPQLWRYTGYLERQLEHVDAFIATSEFSRDKHYEFGFRREMEVINPFLPVDSLPVAAVSNRSPNDRPYFLFVGRLERIKGLDDVIPVFRDYSHADLLIAGEGHHAAELKRLAEGIPNVKFMGRLALQGLDRYYRNALALIVPSAGFETFGITLIEAFRQGTPVIARRIGPFPEIIRRSGGGELFGSPNELIDLMKRFQSDGALRQRLSSAGQESFFKYWSEEAVVSQYLELVRKTAGMKGRTDIVRKLELGGSRQNTLVANGG